MSNGQGSGSPRGTSTQPGDAESPQLRAQPDTTDAEAKRVAIRMRAENGTRLQALCSSVLGLLALIKQSNEELVSVLTAVERTTKDDRGHGIVNVRNRISKLLGPDKLPMVHIHAATAATLTLMDEINSYVNDHHATTTRLTELANQLDLTSSRCRVVELELRQTLQDLSAARAEIAGISSKLDTANSHIEELERTLRATRDDLKSTCEKLTVADSELSRLRDEVSSSNAKLESMSVDMRRTRSELEEYQRKVSALESEMADLRNNSGLGAIVNARQLINDTERDLLEHLLPTCTRGVYRFHGGKLVGTSEPRDKPAIVCSSLKELCIIVRRASDPDGDKTKDEYTPRITKYRDLYSQDNLWHWRLQVANAVVEDGAILANMDEMRNSMNSCIHPGTPSDTAAVVGTLRGSPHPEAERFSASLEAILQFFNALKVAHPRPL